MYRDHTKKAKINYYEVINEYERVMELKIFR